MHVTPRLQIIWHERSAVSPFRKIRFFQLTQIGTEYKLFSDRLEKDRDNPMFLLLISIKNISNNISTMQMQLSLSLSLPTKPKTHLQTSLNLQNLTLFLSNPLSRHLPNLKPLLLPLFIHFPYPHTSKYLQSIRQLLLLPPTTTR